MITPVWKINEAEERQDGGLPVEGGGMLTRRVVAAFPLYAAR